jgi:hypothetical protein
MAYAQNTSVSIDKTEGEIKRLLMKAGASQIASASDITEGKAIIIFTLNGKRIRFTMTLPRSDEKRFWQMKYGKRRPNDAAYKLWEQACRSKWRALLLCIKAKIESYQSGIETFENAFLAHIVIGNNETVSERILPAVNEFYLTGNLKPLLLN